MTYSSSTFYYRSIVSPGFGPFLFSQDLFRKYSNYISNFTYDLVIFQTELCKVKLVYCILTLGANWLKYLIMQNTSKESLYN